MKTNITINGKEVEITLTPEQIAVITKKNQKVTWQRKKQQHKN